MYGRASCLDCNCARTQERGGALFATIHHSSESMAGKSRSAWLLLAVAILLLINAAAAKRGPVKSVWYKAPDQYPEGAAYDSKHDRFLVGSLRRPSITAVKEDGSFSDFVTDAEFEGKSVLGLKVDELRNRVVAAVSSLSPEEIFAAVVAYDLDTAERVLYVRLDDIVVEAGDPEDPDYVKPPSVANDVAVDAKGAAVFLSLSTYSSFVSVSVFTLLLDIFSFLFLFLWF
jgi:hypothetical protein